MVEIQIIVSELNPKSRINICTFSSTFTALVNAHNIYIYSEDILKAIILFPEQTGDKEKKQICFKPKTKQTNTLFEFRVYYFNHNNKVDLSLFLPSLQPYLFFF